MVEREFRLSLRICALSLHAESSQYPFSDIRFSPEKLRKNFLSAKYNDQNNDMLVVLANTSENTHSHKHKEWYNWISVFIAQVSLWCHDAVWMVLIWVVNYMTRLLLCCAQAIFNLWLSQSLEDLSICQELRNRKDYVEFSSVWPKNSKGLWSKLITWVVIISKEAIEIK